MDPTLLSNLQKIKLTSHLRRCSDNDFIDRINNFYTPLILAIFSIVICTKLYVVGEPLQCWVPIQFSDGWEKYSESWCYVKNTYYVPISQELPKESAQRDEVELQYYQWVPFVLGLQAALFLLPANFWKFTNWQAKLHLKPLIQRAVKSTFETGEARSKIYKNIADHIKNCLFANGFSRDSRLSIFDSGVYLTLCYLITKILYLVNIIIQFFIVHRFLKTDFFFGYNLVSKLLNGKDWQETGLFPRVTSCDFTVLTIGQPLHYTLQCVLVINLFNEKIYIFYWFWLAFIFIITAASTIIWIGRMLFGRKLSHFISVKSDYVKKKDKIARLNVCESEMSCDAFFSLKMIQSNCGTIITRRIAEYLLENHDARVPPNKYNSLPPNYEDLNKKDTDSNSSSIDKQTFI